MRDGDNKEPFAARGGLWKPPVPPLPGAGSPSTCPGSTWACRGIWGGHVPEPPLPLGSTYGPSRQLSNSRKLGRSGNEGNKCWHLEKKKMLFCCAEDTCERYCLLLQLRFSEIDLPSPGKNEVRRWSQLGPVKPQILHGLTQAEAKLPPDLEMLI